MHVWVPQEELLRGPVASSPNSIPADFCSQKLWGLIFLTLESWARGPGVDLGLLVPEIFLLNFYPSGCGAHSASAPLLPVRMDVVYSIL